MPVQKVQKAPRNGDIAGRAEQTPPKLRQTRNRVGEEKIGRLTKTDDSLRQINRNRIHADHNKEKRPKTPFHHVNEPVKNRQTDHR